MRATRKKIFLFTVAGFCATAPWLTARFFAQAPVSATTTPWVEPDFPFFSSVVDARKAGPSFPANNLTPRGLVVRVGPDTWAAFDVDLLRISAIWRGKGLTAVALAPGSYHKPDRKTPAGQSLLPEPDGTVWLANGIYPGWQIGERVSLTDPREPAPSKEEVGRGPLPDSIGRFNAIRQVSNGVVLEYRVNGAMVQEHMQESDTSEAWTFVREFRVAPSQRPMWLLLGTTAPEIAVAAQGGGVSVQQVSVPQPDGAVSVWAVRIPSHEQPVSFVAKFAHGGDAAVVPSGIRLDPAPRRWLREVTTTITPSSAKDAFVVDDVGLPTDNPWHRSVRPGDIQFLKDGTGALVTIDGDVWLVRGLAGGSRAARWRRFASGLHEPLTLAIREEQIYVFDRNGIWRLRDTNGDGEADVHELFSNEFAQTADMREFPSMIRLAPGGEFVIAKGGQEAATFGKHNGSVLRISADGHRSTVLGYGFRQPNIGVNIRTGLVTATDQQGNYIPSTPIHIVRDAQFYGFLSDKKPREVYPAPIAEPVTWIPHAASASAMSLVWLFGARLGPLNDALVFIGFNNPELFRVMLNDRTEKPQASVVSITRSFDFPPLHGSVNPNDGALYITGFQILGWGTTATRLAGLGRVRYTGAPSTVPRDIVPMEQGVLLRFDVPLDRSTATNRDNYSLATWHYNRTYQYGSPQYKADGTTGIDLLMPSSAYLSNDARSVFVGVPGMSPVMQMRVGWSLATSDGRKFQDTAYFTPYELPRFSPRAEGFGDITVDSTPRAMTVKTDAPVSIEEGRRLYKAYGCVACHAIDDSPVTKLGPTWKGLYGSERRFAGGVVRVTADEGYLRQSMLEPGAKIVEGYERGEVSMPSYAGVLSDREIQSLILFIKSLGVNH
jgi:glucose/arabinose dehydrogenase/mono/diheme cytochrome c family protein